jgi:biopolymer transport protein ExbD
MLRWNPNSILAAFASAFLILALAVAVSPGPRGFVVELPRRSYSAHGCGDMRVIIVSLSAEGDQLNGEHITKTELARQLRRIYSTRAEKVLYVRADPGIEFQQVAELLDLAQSSVEGVHIRLLTPALESDPCLFIPPMPLAQSDTEVALS